METVKVNTNSKAYPIYISGGFKGLLDVLPDYFRGKSKAVIITDKNVAGLYLAEIENIVSSLMNECYTYIIEPGEKSKSLKTACEIFTEFYNCALDRSSAVISLGGGVVGDIAGFAAALYMRGIHYVQIPTSLLAQVDSSVGGKTAVDFAGGKNIIGAFYQPDLVYINYNSLKTLPESEFISGMGEVIKYGFIKDRAFLDFLMEKSKDAGGIGGSLPYIIKTSCKIKSLIVSADERETGIREILNFGHTFGHAFESLSNFSLCHGKCVALGMICALYLSRKYGRISKGDFEESVNLIKSFGLPAKLEGLNPSDVYSKMLKDKKTRNGEIILILLEALGKAKACKTVQKDDIMEAVGFIS